MGDESIGIRTCTKCGRSLDLSAFRKGNVRRYCAECKGCRAKYERDRRKRSPSKVRAYQKKYRDENAEKIKSWKDSFKEKNPTKERLYNMAWRKRDPARALLYAAKTRAKKYGIQFSIDKSDIVVPESCPILGIQFGPNTGRGPGAHQDSMSLDRVDPSLGYVPGNVQVISMKANVMKNSANVAELLAFSSWVRRRFG